MGDMEELSLKPLSEGLGFYEKAPVFYSDESTKMGLKKEAPPELPEELDLDHSQAYKDLLALLEKPFLGEFKKKVDFQELNTTSVASSVVAPAADSAPTAPVIAMPSVASPSMASTPRESASFEKTFYFSLKAYVIDTFAASLLFFPPLISFVFLTQMDPLGILVSVWPQVLFSFLLFIQVYCLLCRLFCFETFGEAMAKIRLFTLRSQKEIHPFLLFWRFFLICVTGVVFFPFLSLVFKKDFVARLTGLYFQKTENVDYS